MSEIVQNIGTPAMLEAMEANFAEEMMCFGRVLPGGEVQEGPELWWFYTGRPHLNGVTRTHLAQEDNAYIDGKITEARNYFTAQNTPTHWSVSPATRPAHLATRLQAHGFTRIGKDINMAIDLDAMNEALHAPSTLVIQEVEDNETLKIHSAISMRGFDATPEGAQTYYESYIANDFGKGKSWHHYVAWLRDTPVAISSLLLHAGIAGIYGIATLPEVRRQGIGAALTLHTMQAASTYGYRIAILSASPMGLHLYGKLGFQEVGMVYYYSWFPTKQ